MRSYATGRDAVLDVCRRILAEGERVESRGMSTLELLHERFAVEDPRDPIPDAIGRAKLNPAMAALETLQNVAGRSYPGLFSRIAPLSSKASRLMYGERLAGQMPLVVTKLRADPSTRQAVALVWHPDDPGGGDEENLCTIGLQYVLRNGRLDAATFMRSNDAWWGLAYDIPQFAQLQVTVANVLGVEPGRYVHHATSMHLYDRHLAQAALLLDPPRGYSTQQPLRGIGTPGILRSWRDASLRARAILDGRMPKHPTPTEMWYAEKLAPYAPAGD